MRILFRPGMNIRLLVFSWLFFFLYIGPLFAGMEFYSVGSNTFEIRRSTGEGPVLDQDDLEALVFFRNKEIKASFMQFYLKPGSLLKVRRFLESGHKGKLEVLINGKMIWTVTVSNLFRPHFLYLMGMLPMSSSKKKALPVQEMLKKSKKIAMPDGPDRSRGLIAVLSRLNKEFPHDSTIRNNLSFHYSYSKKCEQAAKLMGKKYISTFNSRLISQAGDCFVKQKQYFKAIKYYTRLRKEYGNPGILLLRSKVYAHSYQYPLALRDLSFYLRKEPIDSAFLLDRAEIMEKMKRYEEAIQDYTTIIKKPPIYYYALVKRAYLYYRLRRADLAIKDYKRAIKLEPKIGNNYNALAWLYVYKNSNLEEALRLARKALKLEPGSPHAMDTLAEVYVKLGRLKEANEVNEKALKLARDPELLKILRARKKKLESQMRPR